MNISFSQKELELLTQSLELMDLHLGVRASHHYEEEEKRTALQEEIEEYETLREKIYSEILKTEGQKMIQKDEEGICIVKHDSDLEKKIVDAVEDTETAILYDMIIRHFVIAAVQKRKQEKKEDLTFEDILPLSQEVSAKYIAELRKNGLDNFSFTGVSEE